MLMFRNAKDSYRISMPDGESWRVINAKEAERILKRKKCPPRLRKKIMGETMPGFVMT